MASLKMTEASRAGDLPKDHKGIEGDVRRSLDYTDVESGEMDLAKIEKVYK